MCYPSRRKHRIGASSAPPRFRTIQVCPKDLPALLRQAERAVDRPAAKPQEGPMSDLRRARVQSCSLSMSPDLMFWFALTTKMAITALFVSVATIIAERLGAAVGALVATLPVSAGPVYVFLALDH